MNKWRLSNITTVIVVIAAIPVIIVATNVMTGSMRENSMLSSSSREVQNQGDDSLLSKIIHSKTEDAISELYNCFGNHGQATNHVCYDVKNGDTLWGIADRFLGSGYRWTDLYDGPKDNAAFNNGKPNRFIDLNSPLESGDVIGMTVRDMFENIYVSSNGYFARNITIGPYNDDQLVLLHFYGTSIRGTYPELGENDYIGPESDALMLNGIRYGDAYRAISHTRFSESGKHVSFVGRKSHNTCYFVMDERENQIIDCGNDISDPVMSHKDNNYIVRVNQNRDYIGTGSDQFMVMSDLGNGEYYDYVDSMVWIDDASFAYRVKKDNKWAIVVNHEPQEFYKYIDFLTVEQGGLKYSIENEDGSWTDVEISQNDIVSLPAQRDAQRIADMEGILSAITVYAVDNKGSIGTLDIPIAESCSAAVNAICDDSTWRTHMTDLNVLDDSTWCTHMTDLNVLIEEKYLLEISEDPYFEKSQFGGTGYHVTQNNIGNITVCAPHSEAESNISVFR